MIYKSLVKFVIVPEGVNCTFKDSFNGMETSKTLDISLKQIDDWVAGGKINEVMPNLSPDDRELFLTGFREDVFFGENEDEP